jgi:hypothetical protein
LQLEKKNSCQAALEAKPTLIPANREVGVTTKYRGKSKETVLSRDRD